MAAAFVWTTQSQIALTLLHQASTWDTVVRVATLIMVAVNIVIVTRIATENVILIVEEGIVTRTRTGTPMVVIVEIGVTAAAQHHHEVADVTRPTIGVAEATQEVPPEVAVPCAEEVGITTLLRQSTLQPRLQPIPRLVGKGIILEMV
jgi:hypothetical protein